jgi:hypothetical protein
MNILQSNWLINLAHKFILILFVLSIGILLWRWQALPPKVPLWYSRPWGTDQLAAPYWLFILPVASIALYGVNILTALYVTAEYLIFTQMLFLSSFIVSILSFVALIKILFLVS